MVDVKFGNADISTLTSTKSLLSCFINDVNRMKFQVSSLLDNQRDQDQKISSMTDMIDRLTIENTRVRAEMRTLRDEHTEVLHQMFSFEKKNQDLARDNEHLRTL